MAQQAVDGKSNEITAVAALLQRLDVSGCVVTVDALNAQKEIAREVVAQQGDYVMALKENHRLLYEEVQDYFAWCQQKPRRLQRACATTCEQRDWGHGRDEVRACYYIPATPEDWPHALQQWPGLRTLVVVEWQRRATVWAPEPRTPTAPTRTQHYYLTSLAPDAPAILAAVHAHWQIENSTHWCLDVAFNEDASRVRKDHAPRNLATLRRLVLNLMRQDKHAKCGLQARRRTAGWNSEYLLQRLLQA